MFKVAIIDMEGDNRTVSVSDESFETTDEAQAFAHYLIDRMERMIPDWMQVYSYDIVPVRSQSTTESFFISLINLYETADGRAWTVQENIMDQSGHWEE